MSCSLNILYRSGSPPVWNYHYCPIFTYTLKVKFLEIEKKITTSWHYYTFLAISEFQCYINKIFYNGLYLSIFTQNLSLDAKSPALCVWLIPSLDISDWLLSCNIYYHFFSKFSSVASWSLAAWDIIQHEVRTKWG